MMQAKNVLDEFPQPHCRLSASLHHTGQLQSRIFQVLHDALLEKQSCIIEPMSWCPHIYKHLVSVWVKFKYTGTMYRFFQKSINCFHAVINAFFYLFKVYSV